ncbi:endonuclease domain-containing 1 protein-like [Clarias gariepinus]|uniref:endonuclease domain-containing 1 protein-like n=1 Tax=Clarias gariepinus TaxID=13013 RepID=UPI00234D6BCF|nr:endonuclease domain-containing 1 protein-like [Clarias gariepinus]
MILWTSLTVALFGLLPVHTWAEVVNSFQKCSTFFYKEEEPVGFQNANQNAKKICQIYEVRLKSFYATLYSTPHRIPLYSAYTFNYDCKNKQDESKNGAWFIEPQLSDEIDKTDETAEMNEESCCDLRLIKDSQAINDDYKHTGYDRGHLNPNSFQCLDGRKATFTLTNSVPMDACFNRVQWKAWEAALNTILKEQDNGAAYLVTGAVPPQDNPALDNRIPKKGMFNKDDEQKFNRVTVPTHIWTAVCYFYPLDKEKSFSFGYIGENEPGFSIVGHLVPQLTKQLFKLYNNQNLKIFMDDCFSENRKSEEMVKKLYENVLKHLGDRVNVPPEIILTAASRRRNNEGTSLPTKKMKIRETKLDLVYTDEQEWLTDMENIKLASGLTCSRSSPLSKSVRTGHDKLWRKRETSEELVCTLVPENSEGCKTSCLYREQYGLYYCSTDKTTIPCSPTYSDISVSGKKCRNDHTCGLHGREYYWCYTDKKWDYCSPPLPLGKTKSGKRCSAKRNCAKYGNDYLWCDMADGKRDQCSTK